MGREGGHLIIRAMVNYIIKLTLSLSLSLSREVAEFAP